MTTHLADGNVLIALAVSDHIHHDVASAWFADEVPILATSPITQGTLLRFLLREGVPAAAAVTVLADIAAQPWHEFWPDQIAYDPSCLRGVIGHRQVTDAYLLALASHMGGRVATLDRGLAARHGGTVTLIES